jgi:hypothetical protein
MSSISAFSDDQLQEALRSYGFNMPITATTRKSAEKKLEKFMMGQAGGDATPNFTALPDNQDFADNQTPYGAQFDEDAFNR